MKAVRAKKFLGQHFLINEEIASRITDLILNNNNKNVLEIGPGMGVLTKYLHEKDINLKLVEIDRESVLYLKNKIPELEHNIFEQDFLKINLNEVYSQNLSIIGNFPYNISSQILFKVYENYEKVDIVVGMFQKEVAERVASPSGRKKGILSVLLQTFYDIEYCFTVDENQFSPPPKVKSAVIKLVRNKRKKIDVDLKSYKMIIKAAYNQRRKTINNALKSFNLKKDDKTKHLLKLRAENLCVNDFINITSNIQ
ncbi:16S rRNA (adenine(1518)-N(6)/adenine(1519)-N(6))-dimethyltransferase RsmA [Flavobacteriales bacterium]|nr:16S rRNA (adenine(1518)-N(6)/adenine(1519)-N(6))-dimethyltransferase RsmA [Flavobacteriales bacterium]